MTRIGVVYFLRKFSCLLECFVCLFVFLFNSRSLLFWEGPASLVRAIQISSTQKHWNDIT